jgi:hypothetical protein
MAFLLLVAVQILIFLQGASAGRLYINLQHRHPAHGFRQGVLASCTPANGASCRVSFLNRESSQICTQFALLLPFTFSFFFFFFPAALQP